MQINNLMPRSPQSRLIRACQMHGTRINGADKKMIERQERMAREREEIAERIATFKATQEKFQREREEFFRRTWGNIRQAEPPPFWS
jgi:hypothetical protein